MNVVEVIAEYLLSNRKLVVPNLGAFMVKESGERIFSDLLRNDDGVLISLLQAKGLSDMEAAVSIDRFVFETRHELESYGYCRLGDIGTLRIEPETKVLRLYEPVYGEMPKQTPYIPEPVVIEEETESNAEEVDTPPAPTPQPQQEERKSVSKTMPKAQPRKRVDFVMIFAVVILVLALAGIAYGVYVSTL